MREITITYFDTHSNRNHNTSSQLYIHQNTFAKLVEYGKKQIEKIN